MRRPRTYLDELDDYNYGGYYSENEDGSIEVVPRSELIEALAEERSHLDSVSNVYQTADKIISGEDITVTVQRDKGMANLSNNDGLTITFNSELIEDLDTDTIVSMNGTNYHELAHVLFSPRKGSSLGQFVHTNQHKRAFNMLEEARIERLMVAKYPSTRLFLEASLLEYGLKGDRSTWGDLFPMTTGRKHVDIEVRQMVADKFIEKYGAELAQKVSSIVNEYASLAFPTDFTRGMELIEEYSAIVGKDKENGMAPSNDGNHSTHNDRDVLQRGRPASAKEQKRLQDKASSEGQSENLSDERADNTSNGTENPNHGVGGDVGSPIENDKKYGAEDERIAELLSKRMKDITSDSRIKNEVRDIRKAITGNDEVRSGLKSGEKYENEVRASALMYARRFGIELERLVRNSDPKWEREMPYGKLNVSRTMNPDVNNIDRVFDRWDTGNTNTDIEAVILLDNSGSMGGYMDEVCEKAWIIKRGIESIDGSVTVYNFHSWSELLYDRDTKAKPRHYNSVWAQGSTNPLTALVEAERILTMSNKSIKMLYVVTDGMWDREEEADTIIKRLGKQGVFTTVVFMGDYSYVHGVIAEAKKYDELAIAQLNRLRHGAKVFKAVAKPKDVLELAVDIVKSKVGK